MNEPFAFGKKSETSPSDVPLRVLIAAAKPDARPSFYLEDVHRADFLAVTAPTPGVNSGAFALHGVTDLRIHLSRAAKDTVLASADDRIL